MSTRPIIAELTQRIRLMERTGQRTLPERERSVTSLPSLEGLFCGSNWPRGCLIEWLAEGRGSGSASLALWASRAAWQAGLLVLIESRREWYAPAAVPFAVDLKKTVFIRPERPGDALWALEQVLRTPGVGAVVCDVEGLSAQACRRLQLAAETGGGLGILLRPARARGQPSFAEYRFLVQPLPRRDAAVAASVVRRWRVELLRSRRPLCGTSVVVELRHGSPGVCLVAELESAAAGA